jgi:tRNA dimethylallyltransferase
MTVPQNGHFVVLIAGPTASGKTKLALHLAEHFGAGIINADSMQVYQGLPLLTAQPTPQERGDIPHYLFDYVGLRDDYSVGRWQNDAKEALATLAAQDRPAIIAGGTGLYFKALTEGLVDIPDIDPEIRAQIREDMGVKGAAELHRQLSACDPDLAARLPLGDRQRIARGLEVYAMTGRPLSQWQNEPTRPVLTQAAVQLCLQPDRQWLYARCDLRFDEMISAGVMREVEKALQAGRPTGSAGKILGLEELRAVLEHRMEMQDAVSQAKMMTRRYAKRQMTWFRNQMMSWNCYSEQEYYNNSDKIVQFISKNS